MKKQTKKEKEKEKIFEKFLKEISNQKDIPEDMLLSDEEFWNLL